MLEQARLYVEAGEDDPVITGILNVWQHDPADVARDTPSSPRDHPGRFLLGIGIGHPEATSDYTRPLKTMRDFFGGLDAAETPVPKDERIAAALGPRCSTWPRSARSARTRTSSTSSTPASRASVSARTRSSPPRSRSSSSGPRDGPQARPRVRELYLGLTNYTSNLLKFGYTERDIADGGSDRLIDAVIPHGSPEAIADAIRAHLEAGADHVCLQLLGHGAEPLEDFPCVGEGAALTHPQPAERLLDQLRPVGGRADLFEPDAQEQRVIGRRAGEELQPPAPTGSRRRSAGCPRRRRRRSRRSWPLEAVRRSVVSPITTRVSSTKAPIPPPPGSVTYVIDTSTYLPA